MTKSTMVRRACLFASVLLASACLGDPAESEQASIEGESVELDHIEQAIVSGTSTFARPEVALINNSCTATLISARHFTTAAHCIGFAAQSSGGTLTVTRTNGTTVNYAVDRIVAFENVNGFFDVALGRLVNQVSTADVPSYASIAITRPAANQTVTAMGYGCDNRNGSGVGTKRYSQFTWHNYSQSGSSSLLCGGDSGGPVFLGTLNGNGAMIAINSHIYGPSNLDGFAEVTMFTIRRRIQATIAEWENGLEPGWDRPGLDFQTASAASAAACRTACQGNASCNAFTFVHATGQCFLKRAGVTPVPAAGVTSGLMERIEVGVNRGGSDIATSSASSVVQCEQACDGNARCAAYTWVQSTGVCWMKDVDAAPSIASGVSSGVRRAWDVNKHIPGYDIQNFLVSDWNSENRSRPEVCQAACRNNAACYNWTLETSVVNGTNRCWLKGALSAGMPYSSANGVVSGGTRWLQ